MSFFISESLKGRISEEDLIESDKSEKVETTANLFVRLHYDDELHHDFTFVSFESNQNSKTLTFEIPETYQSIARLLKSESKVEIFAADGILEEIDLRDISYELIRYYERNCYLLKIVIEEKFMI
jgi:hypothetical protein